MQITFQQAAWFSDPARMAKCDLNDPEEVRDKVSLTDTSLDMSSCGWIKLGTATTTVDIVISREFMLEQAISSVDHKIEQLQAECEVKLKALRELKQSFLAIEG